MAWLLRSRAIVATGSFAISHHNQVTNAGHGIDPIVTDRDPPHLRGTYVHFHGYGNIRQPEDQFGCPPDAAMRASRDDSTPSGPSLSAWR
ncbi:hypothetical protein ABIE89_001981 [Bradyrhizobium niftali]|uniref:hypothetical protein n=1 Tax=Bradyrhizobium niftali TaxID=2560055 RepID=UPI00383268D6